MYVAFSFPNDYASDSVIIELLSASFMTTMQMSSEESSKEFLCCSVDSLLLSINEYSEIHAFTGKKPQIQSSYGAVSELEFLVQEQEGRKLSGAVCCFI